MISPHFFIVSPLNNQRYDNKRKYGNNEFIISSSQEDFRVTNRYAVVKSVPLYYTGPIKKDDVVIVHHNVFRIYYDIKGRPKSSWCFYRDNIFIIDEGQIFLYKSDDDVWKATYPYCFVDPIKEDKLTGLVVHCHEGFDLKEGDKVSFQPETEYEFRIDDKLLYRMKTNNICLKI